MTCFLVGLVIIVVPVRLHEQRRSGRRSERSRENERGTGFVLDVSMIDCRDVVVKQGTPYDCRVIHNHQLSPSQTMYVVHVYGGHGTGIKKKRRGRISVLGVSWRDGRTRGTSGWRRV